MRENIVYNHVAPKLIEKTKILLPPPDPEYVCVRYLYCAICGGDYSVYVGRRKNDYPVSLGHEFVAEVVELGEDVQELKVGDYVVSDFNYRCGKCNFCHNHKSHLCVNNSVGKFSNRGFARYANIHSSYLTCIPKFIASPCACFIEPLSCVIHACSSINISSDKSVLIVGGGGIGSMLCFYLKRILNIENVSVCECNPRRMRLLKEQFSVTAYCEQNTQQFNIIIDCSNSISGLELSLEIAEPGSNVIIISHLYGLNTSSAYEAISKKELRCEFPLRNGQRDNLALAAQLISKYWTESDDVLFNVYESIEDAFASKPNSPYCKHIIKAP